MIQLIGYFLPLHGIPSGEVFDHKSTHFFAKNYHKIGKKWHKTTEKCTFLGKNEKSQQKIWQNEEKLVLLHTQIRNVIFLQIKTLQ